MKRGAKSDDAHELGHTGRDLLGGAYAVDEEGLGKGREDRHAAD